MQFRFLVSKDNGEAVNGTLWARDEDSARKELLNKNFDIKLLQCVSSALSETKGGIFTKLRLFFARKYFSRDWKMQFFQQMHTLLSAGITIEQALLIIADGCSKASAEYFVFNGLLSKINTGRSLSDAMSAFRDKFSYTEINVIRAAERVGQPQRAMEHLCEFSEKLSSVRRKIASAMVYPCIVLIVTVCVLLILSTVVIPQFQAIFFTQMHQELPHLTRIVVAACTFFRKHILLILTLPFAMFFCLKILLKIRKRAPSAYKLPIISSLVREYNLYLFTGTLSMLLACNVQLQESLDIAKNVVFDKNLLKKFTHGIGRIKSGEPLSEALGGALSKFASGLILVGERTGSLAASLTEVAKVYQNNLTTKLAIIAAITEPILTVALAFIVGTVIIAIFLPMVDAMQSINIY
ncbi:MAG: type II secretion system F family protein [Puniceicoccales bacterium]|jgi:type II secretory pathway component PulF|nr:type II secretion system F family protein [Puniceicoccales bacterium]